MQVNLHHIRELIASNKTEEAIASMLAAAAQRTDICDQVTVLSGRYRETRKKETLGLISSEEAGRQLTQVNFGLLELNRQLGIQQPGGNPRPVAGKRVFISYSNTDAEVVGKLKTKLEENGLTVLIDNQELKAGQNIRSFIERCVRESDCTLSVISRKSLLSAWVAMESINTFYHEKTKSDKKFIACFIDDSFFDRHFTDEALNMIDEQLHEIETLRKQRAEKGRDTRDLNEEYSRLKDLSHGLDGIIQRLRECLGVDIRGDKLESNFPKILEGILEATGS